MARHDLREVVLVEDDLPGQPDRGAPAAPSGRPLAGPGSADAEPHAAGTRTATGTPRAPFALRRRARWVAVLGVVLALVATAAVADAVRTRRQAERLADVPGLLAPLGPSVAELWRASAGWGHMATVGGDVIVGRAGPDGTDEIIGLDTATGAEQWVAPMPELGPTREIWCDTLGDAARRLTSHVACLLTTTRARGGVRTGVPPDEGALLVVIDTATGERVTQRRMDTRYPALESLGADLALIEVLPDGHVRVRRVRPAPFTVRWTFTSPERLPTAGRFRDTPLPMLQRDVLVVAGGTGWALDPGDGALLDEWDLRGAGLPSLLGAPAGSTVAVLPDGRFAVGRPGGASPRSRGYATVRAAGERDGYTIPGPVLGTAVDDGSADDVLLTERLGDAGLGAQDAASGRRLWTRDGEVRGEPLLLDRRLVAVLDGVVTALDARSGEVLWEVALDGQSLRGGLTTDGVVVAGAVRGPDGERVLVAWGIEDGRERWRTALPADVDAVDAVGGVLLARTEEHLVGLGDPHAAPGRDQPSDRPGADGP